MGAFGVQEGGSGWGFLALVFRLFLVLLGILGFRSVGFRLYRSEMTGLGLKSENLDCRLPLCVSYLAWMRSKPDGTGSFS